MNYAQTFNPNRTPQTQRAHEAQVKNSAGGYSFEVDTWKRLHRFLLLGTEGGSYYAGEQKLTVENAKVVTGLLREDGYRVVDIAVSISKAGRAPKNDPAIYVMALAAKVGDENTRRYALAKMHEVCRTGTHLFQFVDFVNQLGGWGRATRRAVANWYLDKDIGRLAYQVVKYRNRHGWSHRDVLRMFRQLLADRRRTGVGDRPCAARRLVLVGVDPRAIAREVQLHRRQRRSG